jgi:hypothetical protein
VPGYGYECKEIVAGVNTCLPPYDPEQYVCKSDDDCDDPMQAPGSPGHSVCDVVSGYCECPGDWACQQAIGSQVGGTWKCVETEF